MTNEKFLELVAAGDWTAHFPSVTNPYYATVIVSVPREYFPGTYDYAAFGVLFPWEKDESERTAALCERVKGGPLSRLSRLSAFVTPWIVAKRSALLSRERISPEN